MLEIQKQILIDKQKKDKEENNKLKKDINVLNEKIKKLKVTWLMVVRVKMKEN